MKLKLLKVVLFIFPLFIEQSVFSQSKVSEEMYKELELFGEALATVQNKYVEEKKPEDLIYGALSGLLMSLDSYSQFLTPDAYKELLVDTEGRFGGLGIEITIKDGLLTIVSPLEDTPAWKAGLKSGDIIVKIEGELTKGITLESAVKKLRGKPGTTVTITVLREKDKKLEDITLTRDVIKIKDIKRATILEDGVGYISFSEFRESTAKELDKALKELKDKGMKALILDVRYNPGGLLHSAIEIASRFLPDNSLIVYTKSREGNEIKYTTLPLATKYLDIPLVVLINKGSASASEILASALRENKRAVLLGETSFGKGSVQTVVPLSDGSALRITTAKYYTPLGNSIHEVGIEPDIIVSKETNEEVKEDVFEKLKEDKKSFDYKKDYQIVRALDLIRGLMVLFKNN
ncbi:MAG: S41 family peptidase [Candidatus Omnitrophica bacterium]|nr:S41 family peptidase [Candidatus Omnitrophota bacterium]MCM8826933.1 S41 family peptidase [Candidatus Omnitrophota bacterium]